MIPKLPGAQAKKVPISTAAYAQRDDAARGAVLPFSPGTMLIVRARDAIMKLANAPALGLGLDFAVVLGMLGLLIAVAARLYATLVR